MIDFLANHQTEIALAGAWIFSAACSSMPPLPPDAGYYTTWAHNMLQALAANLNKIKRTTPA